MNDNFPIALSYLLKNEGGYVHDPDDSGGATNFGITAGTLTAWRNATDLTHDVKHLAKDKDVQSLTVEEAGEIYRTWYWELPGYDKITSQPIAVALLDVSVLFGSETAIFCAQRALKECGSLDLAIDGRFGPKTLEALNTADTVVFMKALHLVLTLRIGELVVRHPKNDKFRRGWELRVDRLLTLTAARQEIV